MRHANSISPTSAATRIDFAVTARVLAVDPRTPTTLYASNGIIADCGASIRKSVDGGDSALVPSEWG